LLQIIKSVLKQSWKSQTSLTPYFLDDLVDDHRSDPNSARQLSQLSPAAAFMAYLSIVTGCCLSLGLVFAGTDDARAKEMILNILVLLRRYFATIFTPQYGNSSILVCVMQKIYRSLIFLAMTQN